MQSVSVRGGLMRVVMLMRKVLCRRVVGVRMMNCLWWNL